MEKGGSVAGALLCGRYGRFETYNQMIGRFLSSQVQVRLICPLLQLLAKPDEGTVSTPEAPLGFLEPNIPLRE